ncbi:MAG: hypothetical protein DCC67_16265 [Planctomycetota bacterium]|nr:MAG: hypothetical protein DCC67_16265 [Planctomycetota bacterium]
MGLRATILVVEDEPRERQALLTLLSVEGFEPYGAADMNEALSFLERSVDAVVCDLRLPGENGIVLMRRWKRKRPDTPFIFISGEADVRRAVEAVKEGAEDYLVKPLRTAELVARVSQCLEAADRLTRRQWTAHPVHATPPTESLQLDLPSDASMDEIERAAIERALEKHNGNRTRAAHSLGISVRTLQRKLKSWNNVELQRIRAR